MILPDVNLFVYAYSRQAPRHREARAWWEDLMNRGEPSSDADFARFSGLRWRNPLA